MNRKKIGGIAFSFFMHPLFLAGLFLICAVPSVLVPEKAAAAEIIVGTVADELDGIAGNGECSLREAISNANSDDAGQADCVGGDGSDTVVLPGGIYTLVGGSGEDDNSSGDLDLTDDLSIEGEDESTTIIQAGGSSPLNDKCADCVDRVLHIFSGAAVVVDNVTIRYGRAPDGSSFMADTFGGAIFNSGDLTLENCTVAYNRAGNGTYGEDGGNGGAIFNEGKLALIDATVADNETGDGDVGGQAGNGGGIYNDEYAEAEFSGCTLTGNKAFSGGGLCNAIHAYGDMTNSTISGNSAYRHGGGLYTFSSSIFHLNHVTVVNNEADLDSDDDGDGGGFYSDSSLLMENSIVAGNSDNGLDYGDCYGEVVSLDYNLLGNSGGDPQNVDLGPCAFTAKSHDAVGTSESPIDPMLGPLQNYGGQTSVHYLDPESPAVGKIPSGVNGCGSRGTDQRGALRLPPCDIGACEGTFKKWKGSESDDWHNPDNWEENGIPMPDQYLMISSGDNIASCDKYYADAKMVIVSDGRIELNDCPLTIGMPPADPKYELVLAIDGDGTVIQGSWDDAYDRIVNQAQDCLLRFDSRLARPAHIEYTSTSMRFDFQPLEACFNLWDVYAFVYMDEGVKAGLGSSYRRGHADIVWRKDTAQYSDVRWVPKNVYLYAEKNSDYRLTATFYSNGHPAEGFCWSELHTVVVDRMADCKIRADRRIFRTEHIEYDADTIHFDVLGLSAYNDEWNAYAYASITENSRAGIGSSYRRGNYDTVTKKDRSQHSEADWNGCTVDVFCADRYTQEFAMDSSGDMSSGDWDILYHSIVNGACDCRVKYDSRISTPKLITYGPGSLRFDLLSLAAYFDSWEAYGLIQMESGSKAGLAASYRRGHNEQVWKPSASQHSTLGFSGMNVTVRIPRHFSYVKNLAIAADGEPRHNMFTDFYGPLENESFAFDYKTKIDSRIMRVELIEYAGPTSAVNLDYHSLSGNSDGWEAFGRAFLQDGSDCGLAGTYRRGDPDYIYLIGASQSPEIDTSLDDMEIFRR